MSKLPIALICPHAGLDIPPELAGKISLTPAQIFNEADAYVDQIFDFADSVLYWRGFPYARALVDLNRPADPAMHFRPGDGVIKRLTSYGVPVYPEGQELDSDLETRLIERYWQPWHAELAEIVADPGVKLIIDCHSMAALGPSYYSDPGRSRPRAMVGNLGDSTGQPWPDLTVLSAPLKLARNLVQALETYLSDLPALVPIGERIGLNEPFYGGWDLQGHAGQGAPLLMIELNRGLYIGEQHGDSPITPPDEACLAALRERLWAVLEMIVDFL